MTPIDQGSGPAGAGSFPALSRRARWLLVALCACGLLQGAIVAGLVLLRSESVAEALHAVPVRLSPRLFTHTDFDSCYPMGFAYEAHRAEPEGDLYRVLFRDGIKFQYPPSSLLVMPLIPEGLRRECRQESFGDYRVHPLVAGGLVALVLTVLCAAGCYLRLTRSAAGRPAFDGDALLCLALLGALGLTFYPLQKGQLLGQIQVYLGMLAALSLLLFTTGRSALAGACLGLCCWFKPQYAVVLFWALLRREKRFLSGMLGMSLLGLGLSVAVFGLHNQLRYLEVLRMISRSGEVFWPNQSVNGLLHRFLQTASPLVFTSSFGAYRPLIYYATLASSALILGGALWPPPRWSRGEPLDLASALAAATIASPVAWEHHYGAFFAVFAVTAARLQRASQPALFARVALLGSYLLVGNALLRPELLFAHRWLGLFAAHTFWGGLLLFGLAQWMLRARIGNREIVGTFPSCNREDKACERHRLVCPTSSLRCCGCSARWHCSSRSSCPSGRPTAMS